VRLGPMTAVATGDGGSAWVPFTGQGRPARTEGRQVSLRSPGRWAKAAARRRRPGSVFASTDAVVAHAEPRERRPVRQRWLIVLKPEDWDGAKAALVPVRAGGRSVRSEDERGRVRRLRPECPLTPRRPANARVWLLGVRQSADVRHGVGQRLLTALARACRALDGVEYLDAGTFGFMLLPRIEQCDALLRARRRQPRRRGRVRVRGCSRQRPSIAFVRTPRWQRPRNSGRATCSMPRG